MKTAADSTGLTGQIEQGCRSKRPATAQAARNVPGASWITEELVAKTQRVWSPRYGRPITGAEAVEMLMTVKRLAEILLRAERN